MPIKDALLADYDRETALTRKLLERIPNDRLDWKPHPKSTSFIGIARHLAHMLTWGLLALAETASDVANRKPMEATPSIADVLRAYDANVTSVRRLIQAQSEADLAET